MVKAGIIDPTKVVRLALQGAASIGGLLVTTEVMIAEKAADRLAGDSWRRHGRRGFLRLVVAPLATGGSAHRGERGTARSGDMAKQLIQSAEKASAVSPFDLRVTYANGLDDVQAALQHWLVFNATELKLTILVVSSVALTGMLT
jgi:hypothetical protein